MGGAFMPTRFNPMISLIYTIYVNEFCDLSLGLIYVVEDSLMIYDFDNFYFVFKL